MDEDDGVHEKLDDQCLTKKKGKKKYNVRSCRNYKRPFTLFHNIVVYTNSESFLFIYLKH